MNSLVKTLIVGLIAAYLLLSTPIPTIFTVELDKMGDITNVDSATAKALGYTVKELKGKNILEVFRPTYTGGGYCSTIEESVTAAKLKDGKEAQVAIKSEAVVQDGVVTQYKLKFRKVEK